MSIRAGQIEQFLHAAVRAAASDAKAMLGVELTSIRIDESHNVRVDLSDGSLFYIEVNHLVPRNYFRNDATIYPCRQQTNICDPVAGECMRCHAAQGEACRAKAEGVA